jgi:hypothetical protein
MPCALARFNRAIDAAFGGKRLEDVERALGGEAHPR